MSRLEDEYSFYIHQASDWVNTLRENFPVEWHPVFLHNLQPRKEAIEIALYTLHDGLSVRTDCEFSFDFFEEEGWAGIFKATRFLIDSEIENGALERIKERA